MNITLSAIKADIGSVGGHTRPSERVLEVVRAFVHQKKELFIDSYIGFTGDDIHIILSHTRGVGSKEIHQLTFEAFMAGARAAKEQGLYGAGQDLLKDSFSGNIRGMGPGVAEMEFEERPNEAIIVFPADKTEPGAFNVPLYYAFAEASRSPGLILSPDMRKGAEFTILDGQYTEADRVITLRTPEDYLDIASLLFNPHRFMVESIRSRSTGEIIASLSTTRLHNIAGRYVGKDDPIMAIRVQRPFLATEEIGAMFRYAHYVAGDTRGSHNLALMPVPRNTPASLYYCNPIVSALVFSMHQGRFTEVLDGFADPVFEEVRRIAATKSFLMRDNGFVMPSMLPMEEIEYTSLADTLKVLEQRFTVKK